MLSSNKNATQCTVLSAPTVINHNIKIIQVHHNFFCNFV